MYARCCKAATCCFAAVSRIGERLVKRIMQEIERQLDLQVEVVLRTLAEVASIVERGPVLSPRADKSKLLVMFLSAVPDAAAQAALAQVAQGKELKEMLELRGPEIYLYYPEGVGRSKLTGAVIENKLDTAGTARNWNTLQKLVEMGRALERDGRARAERRPKASEAGRAACPSASRARAANAPMRRPRVRRELSNAVAEEADLAQLLQRLPVVLEQRVRDRGAAVAQDNRRRFRQHARALGQFTDGGNGEQRRHFEHRALLPLGRRAQVLPQPRHGGGGG